MRQNKKKNVKVPRKMGVRSDLQVKEDVEAAMRLDTKKDVMVYAKKDTRLDLQVKEDVEVAIKLDMKKVEKLKKNQHCG